MTCHMSPDYHDHPLRTVRTMNFERSRHVLKCSDRQILLVGWVLGKNSTTFLGKVEDEVFLMASKPHTNVHYQRRTTVWMPRYVWRLGVSVLVFSTLDVVRLTRTLRQRNLWRPATKFSRGIILRHLRRVNQRCQGDGSETSSSLAGGKAISGMLNLATCAMLRVSR